MANPLFSLFGGNQPSSYNGSNGLFSDPFQLIMQFNKFKSQVTGDPEQQVRAMLQNGQMSQEQFEYLSTMAQTFRQLLGK